MSRPIRFRAWDKINGGMMSGSSISGIELGMLNGDIHLEYMQFTGLLDKNGVEIYEGDILEYVPPFENDPDDREKYIVEWHDHGFYARWTKKQSATGGDGLIDSERDMQVIATSTKTQNY